MLLVTPVFSFRYENIHTQHQNPMCDPTTVQVRYWGVNSLTPGRSENDHKYVIFNLVLLIGIFRSSYDNALRWMPQGLTDDKSTLVQVMAWCLSQCWPSSLSLYGIAMPQWVKFNKFPYSHKQTKVNDFPTPKHCYSLLKYFLNIKARLSL